MLPAHSAWWEKRQIFLVLLLTALQLIKLQTLAVPPWKDMNFINNKLVHKTDRIFRMCFALSTYPHFQ